MLATIEFTGKRGQGAAGYNPIARFRAGIHVMAAGVNQQHEANGHSSTMSALTVNTARAIGSPLGAEAKQLMAAARMPASNSLIALCMSHIG